MCEDEIEDASFDQTAPRSFEHGHCIGGKLVAVFRICDILIRDPWIRTLDLARFDSGFQDTNKNEFFFIISYSR
jgi:hypothetical protein